jgi:shikimate kinase
MGEAGEEPLVLVGLMGSGKTSVARRLAAALGRGLRDSDADLEAEFGDTAAAQVAEEGRRVLHGRERRHLLDALVEQPPPVIAAAASVVDDASCRGALAPAFVVWLDAPPYVLAERMRHGDHRPHYEPDLNRMLSNQYDRRAPGFREVADLIVDVSEPAPEEVARAILTALRAGAQRGENGGCRRR